MRFLSNGNLQNRIITFRETSFSEFSRRKQASMQTELMTIEVRTSSGVEMCLKGNFSAEMLRTILVNVYLNDSLRYWLWSEPTDMRKSFYTLSG